MKTQKTGRIGRRRHPQLLEMIASGATASAIAETLGVSPETVRKFARNRGLAIARQPMTMEHHPAWNGGTTLDRSGYILRRVPVDGEFGYLIRALAQRGKTGFDRYGYAPEHRIVAHQSAGRALLPGEVVDHIDGDKQNNAPSNLRLFQSNADHLRETLKGRVPNWTPEGRARMTGRPPKSRQQVSQPEPTASQTKTDGPT